MERGAPALNVRIGLGRLIIKEKLGISDRETVEQIKENPIYNTLLVLNPIITKLQMNDDHQKLSSLVFESQVNCFQTFSASPNYKSIDI